MPAARDLAALEQRMRALAGAGQLDACFELALETYGAELLGFLAVMVGGEQPARELYAQLTEALWRALPGFEWRASFRTWAYVAARNAIQRHRIERERDLRVDPFSSGVHAELAQEARTTTAPYLRTENKLKLSELREELEPEERMILVLRVDRNLEWQQIAEIIEGRTLDPAERARRAAAMRKRFERVKERLREMARQAGLLDRDSSGE